MADNKFAVFGTEAHFALEDQKIAAKQDKLTSSSDVNVKTITIGNTSLNETQLKALLALIA